MTRINSRQKGAKRSHCRCLTRLLKRCRGRVVRNGLCASHWREWGHRI